MKPKEGQFVSKWNGEHLIRINSRHISRKIKNKIHLYEIIYLIKGSRFIFGGEQENMREGGLGGIEGLEVLLVLNVEDHRLDGIQSIANDRRLSKLHKKEKNKGEKEDKKDSKNNTHDGAVHLYSFIINNNNNGNITIKMEKICDGCITTAWVNEIKFSPTGKILAVGTHDKKMYFYDIPNMFNNSSNFNENSLDKSEWENCMREAKFIFDKHSSAVLHCDYSLDGKYLQTDSQVRFTDFNICACFPFFCY